MTRDNIVGTLQGDSRLSGGLSVGGSTTDYNMLGNKPKINNVELVGNKNSADLGLEPAINYPDDQTKYYNGRGQWTMPPSGVTSYNDLTDKPSINGVTLSGNKTADDLELSSKGQFNSLSGVIVSFNDGQDLPLAKCIADITPVQDLHGYDKPWAGGAGKNKIIKKIETSNISSASQIENYNPAYDVYVAKIINGVTYYPTTGNMSYEGFVYALFTTEPSRGDYAYNNMRYVTAASAWTAPMDGYIAFRTSKNYATPQFEVGNTPTTYEPYENICPISGRDSVVLTRSDGDEISEDFTIQLGQTVYGGQLNVLTGELTIDRQIVDLGSLTWTRTDNSIIDVGYWFHANITGKMATGETINSNYRTAPYKSVTQLVNVEGSAVDKVAIEAGGDVGYRIIDSSYTDATAFKTAMNGVQMCYFLATPQTVQLTPQEVNSLLGQNNISADTGDISITYINNVNDPIIKYILNNM